MARFAMRTIGGVAVVIMLTGCGTTGAGPAAAPESSSSSEPKIEPPCDTGVRLNTDGPVYSTLRELSAASDAVVRGVVTEQRCAAGTPRGDQEVFYLVSELTVSQSLFGDATTKDRLTVLQLPGYQEDSTPLQLNDEVVLFLTVEQPGDPTLESSLGTHWTPLGWDNGLADVDVASETLVWRSTRIDEGPVTLSDVTDALAAP